MNLLGWLRKSKEIKIKEKKSEMSRTQRILIGLSVFIILNISVVTIIYWLTDRNFNDIDPKFRVDFSSTQPKIELTNEERGRLLIQSIYNQLNRELSTSLGWSVNDIYITKYLDNRKNRQKGILFATRMLTIFYSTKLSKLGMTHNENEFLKMAREKEFAYSSDVWGFLVISSESKYRKGIKHIKRYERDLIEKKAVFNMRSDDVYELLKLITGPQLIDQTMGYLIQKNEEVSFIDLDDRLYYAQGVALVIRDVLHTLVKIDPTILENGGKRNIAEGLLELDKIIRFNPTVVLRGRHDSMFADHRGKVARYLISIDKRIEELMESIRR
jgi:hypothetical protein